MDLFRPQSRNATKELVERHTREELPVLREDFYNSLCASFRPDEVEVQLDAAGLKHVAVETVSDRHLVVYGKL